MQLTITLKIKNNKKNKIMEKQIKKLKELADEYANLIVEETIERRKKEIVSEIKKNIVELEEKLAKLESEQPLQKK